MKAVCSLASPFLFCHFLSTHGVSRGVYGGDSPGHDGSCESRGCCVSILQLTSSVAGPYYFSSVLLSIVLDFTWLGQLIDGMARERLCADNALRKKANGRRYFFL
ncbi:hypothetical protein CEXT_244951 [Caerostris extrusa]|uniref:Secreted protein n=1 Tax=Caerostris extrusa TaxID=172846 RepID=A0AAV4V304_CAEEX|nr:hypothetical protein CEXT_244951 [Caerostris extrusa]